MLPDILTCHPHTVLSEHMLNCAIPRKQSALRGKGGQTMPLLPLKYRYIDFQTDSLLNLTNYSQSERNLHLRWNRQANVLLLCYHGEGRLVLFPNVKLQQTLWVYSDLYHL